MNAQKMKKLAKKVITTPGIYVALVIGALIGGIGGGLGGGISGAMAGVQSGGTLSTPFNSCIQWPYAILNIPLTAPNIDILASTLIGAAIGIGLGGVCIGLLTALCLYFHKRLPRNLSHDSIVPVIQFCCITAAIFSFCLLITAIMGAEVHSLLGPIIGAFIGLILSLLGAIAWIRSQ